MPVDNDSLILIGFILRNMETKASATFMPWEEGEQHGEKGWIRKSLTGEYSAFIETENLEVCIFVRPYRSSWRKSRYNSLDETKRAVDRDLIRGFKRMGETPTFLVPKEKT